MVRRRATRRTVKLSDSAARYLITVSGSGTIAAVASIFVFLVAVAWPLFRGAELGAPEPSDFSGFVAEEVSLFAIDDYQLLSACLTPDGVARVHRLDTGELVTAGPILPGGHSPLTACQPDPVGEGLLLGFEDGSVALASFGFATSFPPPETLAGEHAGMEPGEMRVFGSGLLWRTEEGRFRLDEFQCRLLQELPTEIGGPVRALDRAGGGEAQALAGSGGGSEQILAVLSETGRLDLLHLEPKLDFMTGEEVLTVTSRTVTRDATGARHVALTGQLDNLYVIWEDGRLLRYEVRDLGEIREIESLDLVPEEGHGLTAVRFLHGRGTLMTGDSLGRLRGWFRTRGVEQRRVRSPRLQMIHELESSGPAPIHLAPSERTRLLAAGFRDGRVGLYNVTNDRELGKVRGKAPSLAIDLAPRDDGVAQLTPDGAIVWRLDPGHPEAGVAALFRKVWYEGFDEPAHVWQSDSASDDFEPKLGFMPLIFGTLKATFYTMIFGAPLALLAAIYTSELLSRRLRSSVKSAIELMAGLPSVVLGFLAALVIAPVAQSVVPATMAVFVTVPAALLLGAYLWQLIPIDLAARLDGWPRLAAIAVALPLGIGLAVVLGPGIERTFFAGDMLLWLDGRTGSARGGWLLLLLPIVALLVFTIGGPASRGWMQRRLGRRGRDFLSRVDLLRFAAGFAMTLGLTWLIATALQGIGADPRGSVVDTHVQRNALVVGFVLGFAVIPIIYTLADDALQGVPGHLREASYGAGATPWQTAIRVIVPTATSGLFSALMIGLGRAVGETMIVLMATGNTAIMELNAFNGFRTLSANIAVELPEAVQDSTHYRALFLAALVLFAMTFVLNTLAELVRVRFRKKAMEL